MVFSQKWCEDNAFLLSHTVVCITVASTVLPHLIAANILSPKTRCHYFFLKFWESASLLLCCYVGQTWQPPFRLFTQNIICDVLIGWSCLEPCMLCDVDLYSTRTPLLCCLKLSQWSKCCECRNGPSVKNPEISKVPVSEHGVGSMLFQHTFVSLCALPTASNNSNFCPPGSRFPPNSSGIKWHVL